jgi:hypothetical protein
LKGRKGFLWDVGSESLVRILVDCCASWVPDIAFGSSELVFEASDVRAGEAVDEEVGDGGYFLKKLRSGVGSFRASSTYSGFANLVAMAVVCWPEPARALFEM